jgi:probable O-glycosylation ligase (exosortase A-associated)
MNDLYSMKIGAIWVALKEERASFWLICIYLMLEYVRPQTIFPVIDVLPYALLTLILAFLAYVLERDKQRVKNPENKLLIVFFLVIILSSSFAYSPETSFSGLSLFVSWMVVYFLIINIVNTERKFLIFFLSFLLYNFKMSQHGFISWAQHGFEFRNWGVTGAPGWFQNSGEFGIELCIFLPLSIYFIHSLRSHWSRLKLAFFALLPFTAIASVIATSSRGAMIGATAALLWMVLKSKAKLTAMVLIGIVLAGAYSYLPPKSYERLQASGTDNTSVARLTRWKAGLEIMEQFPVLGIGYHNWAKYYGNVYAPTDDASLLVHNIFIEAGSELGYSGLSVYLLMILYTFVNNRRTRQLALLTDNKFIYYTAHGLDAALIGFMVSGFFVTVLYYPYFWINMSFTVALNNVANRQHADSTATVSS